MITFDDVYSDPNPFEPSMRPLPSDSKKVVIQKIQVNVATLGSVLRRICDKLEDSPAKGCLLLIALCFSGCQQSQAKPTENMDGKMCVYAAYSVMQDTAVTPDVKPSSGDCENCNGVGKVGDGTVMLICPVCDGTGKAKNEKPKPKPKPPDQPAAPAIQPVSRRAIRGRT